MQITKNELTKINTLYKVMLSKFDEEKISEMDTEILFEEYLMTVQTNEKDLKIQLSLKITGGPARSGYVVKMADLMDVVKTFTKKADIDIILESDKVTFKGIQNKEEIEMSLNATEKAINKKNVSGAKVNASDLLLGLSCITKTIRGLPEVASDTFVELRQTYHKLSLFTYSDIELISYNQITDNENDSTILMLNKDEIKFMNDLLKLLKSLEVDLNVNQNGYSISSSGIDIIVSIPIKEGLSVESLITKIETTANFRPMKFKGLDIDEKENKDYIHLRKEDDKFVFTNKKLSRSCDEFSYKINKIFRMTDIDILYVDVFEERNILKASFGGTNYYLMPKKRQR